MIQQKTADEAYQDLHENTDIIFLDVRTAMEYEKGHISNSINAPLQELTENVSLLPDKSKTIYVYCLSGSRSVMAVSLLQNSGFTNVFNMESGLLACRAKGYPIVQ